MTENLERWMVSPVKGMRWWTMVAILKTASTGTVNRVWRRQVHREDDVSMVIHYRMTGQVVLG